MGSIQEKPILEEFKRRIEQRFPGELIRLVLFGSKARGDATPESDLDVLAVVRSEDWRRGDEIRDIGYELEITHGVVLSIQVMSDDIISISKLGARPFWQMWSKKAWQYDGTLPCRGGASRAGSCRKSSRGGPVALRGCFLRRCPLSRLLCDPPCRACSAAC